MEHARRHNPYNRDPELMESLEDRFSHFIAKVGELNHAASKYVRDARFKDGIEASHIETFAQAEAAVQQAIDLFRPPETTPHE